MILLEGTPLTWSNSETALALLSPKAKLYSLVPLSSQCPSILTLLELDFIDLASSRISDIAEALRLYLS